jgi:hypothetical protein
MARQKSDKEGENITVLSDEEHVIELPNVNDAATAVVVADATAKQLPDAPAPEEIPKVRRYVVVRGGPVLQAGFRTNLKEGKVIDSLNYDIQHLQRQGIRLQREESYSPEIID